MCERRDLHRCFAGHIREMLETNPPWVSVSPGSAVSETDLQTAAGSLEPFKKIL